MDKFQVVVSNGLIDFDAPSFIRVFDSLGIDHCFNLSNKDILENYISANDWVGLVNYLPICLKYSFLETEESLIKIGLKNILNNLFKFFIDQPAHIRELGFNILYRCQERILKGIELVKLSEEHYSIEKESVGYDEDGITELAFVFEIIDSNKWKTKKFEAHDYFYLTILGFLVYRGIKRKSFYLKELKNELEEFAGVKPNTSKEFIKKSDNFPKVFETRPHLKGRIKNTLKSSLGLNEFQNESEICSISLEAVEKIYSSIFMQWGKLSKEKFIGLLNIEKTELALEEEISILFSKLP